MKNVRRIGKLFAAALLSAAVFVPLSAPAQATRADAEKDPVLKAMLDELDRSMAHLQLTGFEKPYFIEYRVEEVQDFETRASYGAGEGAQHSHARVARISVRVGDYKTDNSGPRGDGALQLTAIEDDPIALRSSLWTGTDQAYKSALAAYAQKQAELKQVQTPPQADDFSKTKPIISQDGFKAIKGAPISSCTQVHQSQVCGHEIASGGGTFVLIEERGRLA